MFGYKSLFTAAFAALLTAVSVSAQTRCPADDLCCEVIYEGQAELGCFPIATGCPATKF
ncbi:hypothetical protein H0H93_009246 [Arthromyces matolae]|nr:hypothetical protein H0H93_009246 [Arthromyces matolae]